MKKLKGISLGLCCLTVGSGLMVAQQNPDGTTNPPKVLLTLREFLKPGKQGSLHEKSESSFVRAMQEAKYPTHYFAMNSLSGPTRSLFLVAYGSFADWEKDNDAMMHNTTLAAAFDRAMVADGDLLSGYDQAVWTFDEDDSFRSAVKIEQMRYMELIVFKIKPGHRAEWREIVKLYKDGFAKTPDAHWATFENQYGRDLGGAYLVAIPMKSLSEVDQEMQDDQQLRNSLGADGLKKMGELERSAVESVESNLFEFAPKMSYVPDAWVQANPTFWKRTAAVPVKKNVKAGQ